MTRVHIAILKRPYVEAVLAGRKTIESRLTRNAVPPFGLVEPGERIYFKVSAGPFRGMATAGKVHTFDGLTPSRVAQLERRFDTRVGGGPEYWEAKRNSRFATLVELTNIETTDVGPRYRVAHMKAWYALDRRLDPVSDVTLTAGAIRNRYLPLPENGLQPGGRAVTLKLPDGSSVPTDVCGGHRFRWRGWSRWYDQQQLQPGDRVRLICVGTNRYRVQFRST